MRETPFFSRAPSPSLLSNSLFSSFFIVLPHFFPFFLKKKKSIRFSLIFFTLTPPTFFCKHKIQKKIKKNKK
jgi:hypothetical protein